MLRFQLHRNIISLLFHLALLLVLLPALPGDALNLKTFVEQSTGQQKDRLLRRILQETNSSPPSLQQLADSNSRLHLMESTQSFLGSETEAQSPKDAAEPPASGFRAFLDRNSRLRQSLQDFFQHMDKDGDGRVTHLVRLHVRLSSLLPSLSHPISCVSVGNFMSGIGISERYFPSTGGHGA